MAPIDPQQTPPPRRWLRRSLYALGGVKLIIAAVIVGLILWLPGQRLQAPDWVRNRAVDLLQQKMTNLRFGLQNLAIYLDEDLRPTLVFDQISLRAEDGSDLAQLAQLEMALSRRDLLRGSVQARNIYISGAQTIVRRSADGSFNLSFAPADDDGGFGWAAGLQPTDAPAALDALFIHPMLERLEEAQIDDLSIRYEDITTGQAWSVDGARMRANRSAGKLALSMDMALLSGAADVALIEMNLDHDFGAKSAAVGINIENMPAQSFANQSAALAWLSALRAPVSGAMRLGLDDQGAVQPIYATLRLGAGALQPNPQTSPIPFQSAQVYMDYKPAAQQLTLSELSVQSDWLTVSASGAAQIGLAQNGVAETFVGALEITKLEGNPEGLFAQSQTIDRGRFDFKLQLDPFRVDIGQMQLTSGDQRLYASADIEAAQDGWMLRLDGGLNAIDRDRMLGFWPQSIGSKTRKWLGENLIKARARDIEFGFRRSANGTLQKHLSLIFEDAQLQYLKTLPPLMGASGHLQILDKRLQIHANAGQVMAPNGDGVEIAGTSFVIPLMKPKGAIGQLNLQAATSVGGALSLLELPPVNLLKNSPLDHRLADGDVAAELMFEFPLGRKLTADEITQSGTAVLRNISSTRLVTDHDLRADELMFQLTNAAAEIRGRASLDGLPLQGVWRLNRQGAQKGQAKVLADAQLTPALLRNFKLPAIADLMTGAAPLSARLDLQPGQAPILQLRSDMVGLGLDVPSLVWSKQAKDPITATAKIRLAQTPVLDDLVMAGAGLDLQLSAAPSDGGSQIDISRLRLKDRLDAVAQWTIGAEKNTLSVQARKIDLRPWMSAPKRAAEQALHLDLTTDELRIGDALFLGPAQAQIDINGTAMSGPFTGRVNGGARIDGAIDQPANKPLSVRLRATDAGAILRDAGAFGALHGGSLVAQLTDGDAGFTGPFAITQTALRDAPVMAELLNAVSVIGLIEQLSGPGIKFNAIEGQVGVSQQSVSLKDTSAVGASMGISLDGLYNFEGRDLDMRGTLSPVYALNILGAPLSSRRGEGLFGFNFTLKGPADDPKVRVNLLSVLVPGVLRDLFRAPTPSTAPADQ